MPRPRWSSLLLAALPLAALAALLSCQNTTVVEEDPPPATGGAHDVQFSVPDSALLPDSLWYRSPLDSGTQTFYVVSNGTGVRFLPELHPLEARDTLSIHTFRLGLHLGQTQAVSREYRVLRGVRTVRTASDSLAWSLLRAYDSLRKAHPADFKDTSALGRREAFQTVVATLVFQGHPASASYKRLAPAGLDTAKVNRQILTLAAGSGQTLGEVVRRWNLALDYPAALQLLVAKGLDSASLHPFSQEGKLSLDTLHLGEPPVGLGGKVSGRKGVMAVKFTIEKDSSDQTERFVLADVPEPKGHPSTLDFGGHPTFQARATTAVGQYTLRVRLSDSLGNQETFLVPMVVAGALDRSGPSLTVLSPASSVVRDFHDSVLSVKVEAKDGFGVQWVKIGGREARKGTGDLWTLDSLVVPVSASSVAVAIESRDGAGNTRDTVIQVRRNEAPKPTAPRLTLVAPSSGTLVPYDSVGVWVEWKAVTDFGTIEAVTVDGKSAKLEGDVWRLRVSLNPDGKLVTLPVRASSSVGLSATEVVSVGRKADSSGPAVRWGTPGQGHRVAYDVKSLEVKVSVADPSGVDSVRIAGKKPDTSGGLWGATVDLANPGEIARIHVKAWDRLGNATDSVLLVSRDPIPGQLPPSLSWMSPSKQAGTVVPFSQARFLVQVVLTDISGIDASSVEINGTLAKAVNDSVWELSVDLPPTGLAQTITLVAKNKRGVSGSGFVSVARAKDEEKPTSTRGSTTQPRSVLFDTSSIEVSWTAQDNDRISQAWIQDSAVVSDGGRYHRRVPLEVGTQWIKFRAVDPAGNEVRDSVSVERRNDTVKAVTFSDTNGKLRSGSFWVKLSCATPGATIRYTLDGSEPKATSPIFADSIKVDTTLTLKARGYVTGRVDGPVATQAYQLAVPVKVFAGLYHSLVILSDSSLWGYGLNNCNAIGGDLGCVGTPGAQIVPRKLAEGVIEASASNTQSYWLKSDGTLWAVGTNALGSLGVGVSGPVPQPTLAIRDVSKVRSFERSSSVISLLVLKKDGTLWGAGSNSVGQIGLNSLSSTNQLLKVADSVTDFGGGMTFGYFTKRDGSFWMMGRLDSIGLNSKIPKKVMDSVSRIPTCASRSILVLKENGDILGAGQNDLGQLGLGTTEPVGGWRRIQALEGKEVTSLRMAPNHTLAISKNGNVYGMGSNSQGELIPGLTDLDTHPVTLIQQGAVDIGAGDGFSTILDANGRIRNFGGNLYGQLGGGQSVSLPQDVFVKF